MTTKPRVKKPKIPKGFVEFSESRPPSPPPGGQQKGSRVPGAAPQPPAASLSSRLAKGNAKAGAAQPPAPPATPAEAHAPAPQPPMPVPMVDERTRKEIDELKDELDAMRKSVETKEVFIAEQLAGITENLEGIQTISEMLSVKYNPFLKETEIDVFDGQKIDPGELIRRFMSESHDETEPEEYVDVSLSEQLLDALAKGQGPAMWPQDNRVAPSMPDLEPAPSKNGQESTFDQPPQGEPLVVDMPAIEEKPRMTKRRVETAIGGPRETYLALAWLEELAQRMPPPALYLCLDHYHQMDWIDPEVYDWLCGLAAGMVDRDEGARWSSYDMTPADLSKIHRANLMFLSDLFSEKLRSEEQRILNQSARSYFEGL